MTDPVLRYCLERRNVFIERLSELLRCPSVSTDASYEEGMEAARRWLERWLAEIGFTHLERLDAGGHPALFAQRLDAPGRPTLLVYGHYDVQPPDPVDKWQTPPFAPTIRDGRLYARGASDDKGPSLIALEALAGFIAVEGALPVNIKVLLEGEEETGSPSLARMLSEHRNQLAADAVLSADGARWRADLPSINVGSRGNSGFGIRLTTAAKDLHSGRYGGAVPNALHVMAGLIASLHDEDGRVSVPGFYEGIDEWSMGEQGAIARIPFDETSWLAAIGACATGEAGYSTLERLWYRPTLEINGLWGGYQGAGAKTVIPHEASAKLTTRLVTGQDPDHINAAICRHLSRQCPAYANLEFLDQRGSSRAYTLPPGHPLLTAAEEALQQTTGQRPIHVRIGATLPLTDIVMSALGLHTVMFSFSTADEDYHAPNEFLRVAAIDEGLAAWIDILRRVGRQDPADYAAWRVGA